MSPTSEGERLARFSRAVRQFTLKRLGQVPRGKENWRPTPDAMSFADQALHLIDCDNYLFDRLEGRERPPVKGPITPLDIESHAQFETLIEGLERSGRQRAGILEQLEAERLDQTLMDSRYDGEISVWWLIVRGNLDHEIHHRGQLAAYIRMAGLGSQR